MRSARFPEAIRKEANMSDRNDNVTYEYFAWLLNFIDNSYVNIRQYNALLLYLFDKEFIWMIPNDSNRALDAMELRFEFLNGYQNEELDLRPCSVLEVLIRLAIDWEHEITYDFHKGDRSSKWFWTMVGNLGLLEYTDDEFDIEMVDNIVENWLNRSYQKNGEGGIFPIKNGNVDQTKVEIWLQLQNFVLENVKI